MEDKKGKSCFFKEIFLFTNISMNIALGMPFFTLSNIEIEFVDFYIYWKLYTFTKVLLTIKRVKLVRKKEFIAATFYPENEVFIVYVVSISLNSDVYSFQKA